MPLRLGIVFTFQLREWKLAKSPRPPSPATRHQHHSHLTLPQLGGGPKGRAGRWGAGRRSTDRKWGEHSTVVSPARCLVTGGQGMWTNGKHAELLPGPQGRLPGRRHSLDGRQHSPLQASQGACPAAVSPNPLLCTPSSQIIDVTSPPHSHEPLPSSRRFCCTQSVLRSPHLCERLWVALRKSTPSR